MLSKKLKYLFVLVLFVFATAGINAQCKVVINEIMASPVGGGGSNSIYDNYIQASSGPTLNAEWVELYNPNPCTPIDISCYILGSNMYDANIAPPNIMANGGTFTFPVGTIIPPLGYISVGGAASAATFKVTNYVAPGNLCVPTGRWYLRDSNGYIFLSDANGNVVNAVYWGATAGALSTSGVFQMATTTACACNLPGGPGTATKTIPAAKNIPGIEYAGDNVTANAATLTYSNAYTMHRQYDGSSTWVIDGNNSLNSCNVTCYSWNVNAVAGNTNCAQSTTTATASYTNTALSHAPYTFSWAGGIAAGATAASVSGLPAGTYTVTLKDVCGCTKTTTTSIAYTGVVLNVSTTPTSITCASPTATALANASNGNGVYTYSWSVGQQAQMATGLTAGIYTVTATDGNGCTGTATTSITQIAGFTLSATGIATSCAGADGTATAIPIGAGTTYTYSWSSGGQTTAVATGLGVGVYTVQVLDGNSCSASATVNITQPSGVLFTTGTTPSQCTAKNGTATVTTTGGTAPFNYSWSVGQTGLTATGLSAGTYTVTVTDKNNCSATATASVAQQGSVALSTNQPPLICPGVQTILTATANGGTAPFIYSWNIGANGSSVSVAPISNTTYTATVTDANGCSASQTVIVSVNNTPLLIDPSADQEFCAGGQATLSVTPSSGTSPYVYSWVSSATTSTITVSPTVTTSYSVTVTDACNISTTKTIQVTVHPIPVALFNGNSSPACDTACVIFHDQSAVSSGTIANWLWDFGDGNTSTSSSPSNCYAASGAVSVSLTVTSDKGCKHTATLPITIDIEPKPNPDFTYTPARPSIMESPVVSFTSLASNAVSWSWSFGDSLNKADDTSADAYPQHTYSAAGIYCIELVVENKLGCSDSITKCLEVRPDWTFFVPNCFTPEGNGNNEIFKAQGTNITNFEMFIYDRWGNEVFHSNDINTGWNGKVQGGASNSIAQTDVYVWLIKFKDVDDHNQTYVGSVTLLR